MTAACVIIRTAANYLVTSDSDQTLELFTSSRHPLHVDIINSRRRLHMSKPLDPKAATTAPPPTLITVRPKVSESLPLLVSEEPNLHFGFKRRDKRGLNATITGH